MSPLLVCGLFDVESYVRCGDYDEKFPPSSSCWVPRRRVSDVDVSVSPVQELALRDERVRCLQVLPVSVSVGLA
jgi:hypothetical protein